MSWSFYAIGAASAVRTKAREEFTRNPCAQPEEMIRRTAGLAIDMALTALPDDYPVSVKASGSQCGIEGASSSSKHSNSLKLEIEPINGYVR